LWLAKDNRLLNPKSSYERILMAPTCRLIAQAHILCLYPIPCFLSLSSLSFLWSQRLYLSSFHFFFLMPFSFHYYFLLMCILFSFFLSSFFYYFLNDFINIIIIFVLIEFYKIISIISYFSFFFILSFTRFY